MRNLLAPINKLPPEILVHVCTLAPEFKSGYSRVFSPSHFAHVCAQVCRYWRHTLITSPSLWNEIHTDDPIHMNVHLGRSGKVPLDMYVHEPTPAGQCLWKVIPHLGRVQLLYIYLLTGDGGILDRLQGPEMLLLRTLYFEKGSAELILSVSMMEKISSLGVNTTDLFLWNVDAHMSSLTFPRLRYFTLVTQIGFEGLRVSDMIGFLRGHPLLEEVELNFVYYPYADDAGTDIEPAVLPHLKCARLGGKPSSPSLDSLPYIEVDLLPYLRLPSTGGCGIGIDPMRVTLPHDTNYLLTLIHAWEVISGPGGSLSPGFTRIELSIKESPSTLVGRLEVWIAGWGSHWVGPEDMVIDSWSWSIPDWEATTTDEDLGGDDGFEAQLSRIGCYLDPLRWSPSPLAAVETLSLRGFGYTRNKGKYLQYLRECFVGLNRVREFQVDKTNPGMVVHLLQPFEDGSGGVVLLFPLLQLLVFSKCAPAELPQPRFLDVVKKRAALGNVLEEVRMDDKEVDLSGLSEVQEET